MGEPGGLPSMGSHRVGHDSSDLAAAAAENFFMYQLAICVSSLQKCLFKSFAYFKIKLFAFLAIAAAAKSLQ